MIGPVDCLTTSKSGERAGAGAADAAGELAGAFASCFEHPVKIAVADATRVAYPKLLRVMAAGAFGSGLVPQVEQPPVPQLPHELSAAGLITTSDLIIAVPLWTQESICVSSINSSALDATFIP